MYWQRQFKQNYTRSLDHRSFYFKVIDKKVLGLRHIVQEIKDAAEATQQAPEKSLSMHTSAPASVKLSPDVILEMPDKCVVPHHLGHSVSVRYSWHPTSQPSQTGFSRMSPSCMCCREVHGDVWALVQIGFVGSEVKPQVEQFWKSIVLPFFRVTDVASMTPEFGPPSPSATVDADRSTLTTGDTPAATPAQSAEGSGGAIAGTVAGEQSGASSEAAGTISSISFGYQCPTILTRCYYLSFAGSAAAVGVPDGSTAKHKESPVQGAQESAKAVPTGDGSVIAAQGASSLPGSESHAAVENHARAQTVQDASEISKMEESDIDDVEEAAGGKGSGKGRNPVDEDEDDDDAGQAAAVNRLVPSASVLPLEFEVRCCAIQVAHKEIDTAYRIFMQHSMQNLCFVSNALRVACISCMLCEVVQGHSLHRV